ncbi:MAG TPA: ATP-binding protein [Gemmatimonadales bacterium]|nr:ATP-binding protein [Gemmatimonadales bacterium]
MTPPRARWPWLLWIAALAILTLGMHTVRGRIEEAHVVIPYLLVVLGGSATGGRTLGFTLAVLSFLLIDYYFQQPFDTLAVGKPLDWVVLLAFLATAGVATQLLARAQDQAREAEKRARQVEELSRVAEHATALSEANRLKDWVLASVSHDLRTPLTTIKALAQESAAAGDSRARIIEEQADHLSRMVGDLLALSRIKAGAFPLELELNTSEDLIGALVARFASLPHGRLTTVVHLEQPADVGRFDFVQSLRILGNLVENALRFAPPETAVELEAMRRGDRLAFEVRDRGPGVDIAERERIFEAFYRPSGSPPDSGRAGLGLAIARMLAELQGGTLVYSPRDGGGSTFTLWLPAADVEALSPSL